MTDQEIHLPSIDSVMDQEQILQYTMSLRRQLVNKAISDGIDLGRVGSAEVLRGMLSDMDKAAQTAVKLKQEKEAQESTGAEIHELVGLLRREMGGTGLRAEAPSSVDPEASIDPNTLTTPELVPGELDDGVVMLGNNPSS